MSSERQEASDDVKARFNAQFCTDSKADPYDLGVVVMPLIRIMKEMHMSWAQRTEVAWAIQEALRQHTALMDEHRRLASLEMQGSGVKL